MFQQELKVVTLNCWGLPFPIICQRKDERIKEICRELQKKKYDVVFLQEIWTKKDYNLIKKSLEEINPHSFYFDGGVIGSGMCIFSKFEIEEVQQHRFSLNGYPHRIFCGDWWADKSIGLAKMSICRENQQFKFHAYVTHLHAQYSPINTTHSYDVHRCLQAYELSRFLKETSKDCHFVILAGDFNTSPEQVGYGLIKEIGGLRDSWEKEGKNEPTFQRPDNFFSIPSLISPSKRIDYIMSKANPGFKMEVESCDVTLNRIPGKDLSFSDHVGIEASYILSKGEDINNKENQDKIPKLMSCALEILERGMNNLMFLRKKWLLFVISLFFYTIFLFLQKHQFIFIYFIPSFYSQPIVFDVFEGLVLILLILSFMYHSIFLKREVNVLQATINDITLSNNFQKKKI